MTNPQMLKRIENMEDQLQILKLSLFTAPKHPAISKERTVKATAGLLGKDFPSGVIYEKKIRSQWNKRIKKLGL